MAILSQIITLETIANRQFLTNNYLNSLYFVISEFIDILHYLSLLNVLQIGTFRKSVFQIVIKQIFLRWANGGREGKKRTPSALITGGVRKNTQFFTDNLLYHKSLIKHSPSFRSYATVYFETIATLELTNRRITTGPENTVNAFGVIAQLHKSFL